LYFSFFSASFCVTFLSAGIATSVCMFSVFFVLKYYIWPICHNFCTYYYYYYYYYYVTLNEM
jgi:hypothetical protein